MNQERKKFIESYKFCLEYGWVHNTPTENVLLDYFDNKNGRKKIFNDHIGKILKREDCNEINILLGEAPPYYPNTKYPEKKNRQYFYDSKQSMNTPYFKEPCKHFLNITDWKNEAKVKPKKEKEDYLKNLIEKGVLIFDIFPFPIFQSTDIRENIVYKDGQSSFMKYLDDYFEPRLQEFLDVLPKKHEDLKIKMYLFAPKLASVQFLYWLKGKSFYKYLIEFDDKQFSFSPTSKSEKGRDIEFINKSLTKFLDKISKKDENIKADFLKILKLHPIFMNESGNPDFNNFVNGKKNNNL
jgi:hypothetical protein